jgi:transposase
VGSEERDGFLQRIEQMERRLEELTKENVALREENTKLRKEREEWRRGFRERPKRRTSSAEGKRSGTGRPRGRAPGHTAAHRPVPRRIDRTVDYPIPDRCECGGEVEATREVESTIVQDIPPVRVENVRHVGRCRLCCKRVSARLPGATAAGQNIIRVQLGANICAMALGLRFEQHVPLAGIATVFHTWFGLTITPGGLSHMFVRLRRWSQSSHDEIVEHVRASDVLGMDETGIRQDGLGAWAWIARTDSASLFRVELSRGSWVAEKMLGEGFSGVVCTDFYGVYTRRVDWAHGYCGAHLVREAKKIAEVSPGPLTERLRDGLQLWYAEADRIRVGDDEDEKRRLIGRLRYLARDPRIGKHPEVARLQKRIRVHFDGLVRFVQNLDVEATNNASERDIRAFAVHRRVTGGTRSAEGSATLGHWMSITQTLRKNRKTIHGYVVGLHAAHARGRPPPTLWARE